MIPDTSNDIVEGKNAVSEVIKSGRQINKLWIAIPDSGRYDPFTYKLMKDAKDLGAVIVEADRRTLDRMSVTHSHQGVIARVAAHDYSTLDEIMRRAEERSEDPLIIVLDGLKDPYNLGGILRVADAAGVHGIIIPKHRSVGLDAAVAKTSAGAIEYIPVVRVTNLSNTIEELKEKGFWIYATHQNADKSYCEIDYKGAAAIVIGSEGEGISDKIIKNSDFLLRIPMRGNVNSLNAAVAAGIVVFEAIRSRTSGM
ncbi:MAG: 23S rRNA (guanosine(2251)-2'-O)-methyltransferase RlmB [Eubacteriales bacterium]|nr:23S rRNA (guanosine(2251)-2'-O)-methyltransferase RlmB [Eubacteriales bacterium]MDD4327040.1 23S rRNA (guanosine(2251)-2'-O)-methyltransferase RlmB [Eubacteriales bacterium]MDD4716956.1 23S rRNA (guanosine(2251)-2'-O)-methyltransferase RlmB [Eubacteriales bacterium]